MFDDLRHRVAALRRAMFDRSSTERDLSDEINLHIELETARNVAAGHSPAEARRLALVAFGGVDVAKEAHRDGRYVRGVHEVLADVQYALRTLKRSPVFAITAIITLGLGIGATTAIFSVVNAVVLRPLPFASPNRLVMLWEENPDRDWKLQTAAPANYMDWHDNLKSIESSAAILDFMSTSTLTKQGEPRQLTTGIVTGGFFSTLGVLPQMGRSFREEETWATGNRVAMLSHRLWQQQFGARPDIVGQTIELDGRNYAVIGVLPDTFRYPGVDPDIWMPTGFPTANKTRVSFRRAHYLRVIARLRDGATVESATAEIRGLMSQLEKAYPETNTHMQAGASPLHEFLVGNTRRPLFLLLSAVTVLLLIACANVGNLSLVQAALRQREVMLRLALGASRARLFRQAVTESVTLAVIGGVAGLLIGWTGMRALASLQPPGLLPAGSITMHSSELAFALVVATLAGLLFGVAPALWNTRRVSADVLKDGGRGGSGRSVRKWGAAMVVTEVSLAVLLTLGAGLLVRSYWQLQHVNAGFNPDNVMTMSLSLPGLRYDSTRKQLAFYDELVARAQAIPGVQAAATISNLPATSYSWSSDFAVAGRSADQFGTEVVHRETTGDYAKVMQLKLIAGRLLTNADNRDAPPAVLINDELARRFFPGEDPIGKRVVFDKQPDSASIWRTIVGVVASERQANMAQRARPEFISPLAQEPRSAMTLVVRTGGSTQALPSALRRVVAELDPLLAVSSMRSMNEVRSESVSRERFLTAILLVFSIVGVVLAIVGVYGVMAQTARGRTREMGIRIALGAPARGVQWLVVRYGLSLTTMGIGIGIAVAMALANTVASLLYEVKPIDPVTFISVPALLLIASVTASWLPAWRASRVDPTITLRAE